MSLVQIGLIILSGFPMLATLLLGYQLLRNGQGTIGKPSISPVLFYVAKGIAALVFACLFVASIRTGFFQFFPWPIQDEIPAVQKLLALIFLLAGNLLLVPAYYSLGIFTRAGLPTGPHALETDGVYRISRNPMYTSFLFFFTACFLLIPSLLLAGPMLFSLIAHHFIILNEEKYLFETFKGQYLSYKKDTARYL
jgi:protein-S-isoprenylcysteine O-methyltransferase Ste14